MTDEVNKILGNHAQPKIVNPPIQIDGFTITSAEADSEVTILVKSSLTSLDADFYIFTKGICETIGIKPAQNLLIRTNSTETLIFEDNLPVTMQIKLKKPTKASHAVMENDLTDITGISFQDHFFDVNPKSEEKVICILSYGYMHGLYFDFTGKLDAEVFKKEIGFLYRQLMFNQLYLALKDGIVDQMIKTGWFPFVQILGSDVNNLIALIKEQKPDTISRWSCNNLTDERVKYFTGLWEYHDSYKRKKNQIDAGLKCFYNGDYIAAQATLTPLIEGIFNEYSLQKRNKGISYKGSEISKEISKQALLNSDEHSTWLPLKFREYLDQYFFKNTSSSTSDEIIRNTVSHGRANDDAFTREAVLTTILTIDQIFCYMDR